MKIIDAYMPSWHYTKKTKLELNNAPDSNISEILKSDFRKSFVVKTLFFVRGIPTQEITIQYLIDNGFILLEQCDDEVVLGLVGQPWKWKGTIQRMSPKEFLTFNHDDFVKVIWNFAFDINENGHHTISTETRIFCTSKQARMKFSFYWSFIHWFSAWIRKEMLKIIRHDLESK